MFIDARTIPILFQIRIRIAVSQIIGIEILEVGVMMKFIAKTYNGLISFLLHIILSFKDQALPYSQHIKANIPLIAKPV